MPLAPLTTNSSLCPAPRAEKDKDLAANMARFAFCKEDESLTEACKRLLALRAYAIDASKLPPLP